MPDWDARLALYDRVIKANPCFERKGKAMPYTSANGHMFSQINKDGEIGIRLSDDAASAFLTEYKTTPFKAHGAVMKGYVTLPDVWIEDENALGALMEEGYRYVMSLKPKTETT